MYVAYTGQSDEVQLHCFVGKHGLIHVTPSAMTKVVVKNMLLLPVFMKAPLGICANCGWNTHSDSVWAANYVMYTYTLHLQDFYTGPLLDCKVHEHKFDV